MITGDSRRTAEAVASALGLDRVEAEVLPEDQAAAVQRLRNEGHVVATVGDGVSGRPPPAALCFMSPGRGDDGRVERAW